MTSSPPLRGIRVLELAGLAPVPFAGLLLADYGASVLRIDRPNSTTPSRPPPPAQDLLTRHKASIPIDLKSPSGISFLKSLIPHVDVLLDPFRPGVLEKLGLCPATVLQPLNPRLVVGRLTGFRPPRQTQRRQMTPAASHASDQDAYSSVAGHDINYLALSGVLSLSGRAGEKPYAPGNLVADFGGGGMMLVTGILMALLARERGDNASPLDESSDRGPQQHSNFGLWQGKTKAGEKGGLGQIVQANMVDGSAYLASMPLLVRSTELWNRKRGENMFDGGCPWYDTYETKEGGYVAVGALEPPFFLALLKGLSLPSSLLSERNNRETWPELRTLFTAQFLEKTRREWEDIFRGTDACVTPVLAPEEVEYGNLPVRVGSRDEGMVDSSGEGKLGPRPLGVGEGGDERLRDWVGWVKGTQYDDDGPGGFVLRNRTRVRGSKL